MVLKNKLSTEIVLKYNFVYLFNGEARKRQGKLMEMV
jgi:hypothetical protein